MPNVVTALKSKRLMAAPYAQKTLYSCVTPRNQAFPDWMPNLLTRASAAATPVASWTARRTPWPTR
jgi:hypothetical protein